MSILPELRMREKRYNGIYMKKVMVRALFGVFFGISWAVYASDSPEFTQKLLELNAPVVCFHPKEPYFPLAVEHFFKNSALYDKNGNIVIHRGDLTVPLLAQYHGPEYTEYRLSPILKYTPEIHPYRGLYRHRYMRIG